MKIKKIIYALLGLLFMGLGIVGIVLPILPTVPFMLLAAFFFAGSSEKINEKFLNSSLYEKYIKDYKENKSMPMINKIKIISIVTALLLFAFYKMSSVPIGRVILIIVWIGHVYFFFFHMPTSKKES